MKLQWPFCTVFTFFCFWIPLTTEAWSEGLYITQPTMEYNTSKVRHLIQQSKAVGIDTFVIDYKRQNKQYRRNLALIKQNRIHYIARIVMFPHDGGLPSEVQSQAYLEKRYRQIRQAVSLGAEAIQLDYIPYRPTQPPSPQNAKNIYKIIKQVRDLLKGSGVKLQVDVFGIATQHDSLSIGHKVSLFARSVDAICPMVYPSHYEPFRIHSTHPYQTVYDSLMALHRQLRDFPNVKIYAYIEVYNYRYPLSWQGRINYIRAEIRAVRDAKADGWYAWSPRNQYGALISILKKSPNRP